MLSANVNVDLVDLSCPKQNVDFLRDPFERDAGYGICVLGIQLALQNLFRIPGSQAFNEPPPLSQIWGKPHQSPKAVSRLRIKEPRRGYVSL